ncbi:MAG: NAD(P)/FAD-dependent oxidoreductase [Blautia sp.]|nr:NAD(P)/FAD-dependent oxidoreductase [Blautia sp.]
MEKRKVLIIGAGASGLMAGIMAARNKASVTILEQNEKPGKKICATGNGKCNFTNLSMQPDGYRGTHPDFVKQALGQFSVKDTVDFFQHLGICPLNRNGYLYPRSGQAQSMVDVLCMEAANLGIKIKTNEKAVSVETGKKFRVLTKGWHYEADALILSNGSRASSISGSDGSGYALAESLGHHIIPVYPALTALKCKGDSFKLWAGVRTEGEVSLYVNDNLAARERGELQLTEYGISGIPVFQLSRYAVRAARGNQKVDLTVDFLPEYTSEQLVSLLSERKKSCPYKNEKELLIGLFPEKLIKVLLKQKDFISAVKSFPLKVSDGLDFSHAQVCSGGVDTAEMNSCTMESRLCRNLYITGELLDIDGTCGGYNLQWAWSSGAVAGINAAKESRR